MRRTEESGGRRRLLAWSLVLLASVVALVVMNGLRDAEPSLGAPEVAAESPTPPTANAAAPANGTSNAAAVVREPDATPGTESVVDSGSLRIETRDNAGAAVAGVLVTVRAGNEVVVIRTTSADGAITVAAPANPDDLANWRIVAGLPGRTVSQPFLPFTRPSVVVVSMGDIGSLRVTCAGATGVVRLSVLGEPSGEVRGVRGDAERTSTTNTARAIGDAPTSVAVPAGAFDFHVSGTCGERTVSARVAGPRRQSDVVDVALQFASCRVTGRVASDEMFGHAYAVMVERDAIRHFGVVMHPDFTFAVDLPRTPGATVSIVNGRACALLPRTTFTTAAEDVGAITFARRPWLGLLEARDDRDVLCLDSPSIRAVTTTYGTTIDKSAFGVAVWFGTAIDKGVDVFGVPGLVAAEVVPSKREMFCVPESLTIRDGGAFHAMFVKGGLVVVRATEAGPRTLHRVELVAEGRGQRFASTAARLDGDLQRYTFRGLPPGVYRAEVQGAHVVGNVIEVRAGSEQEVDVTIVP